MVLDPLMFFPLCFLCVSPAFRSTFFPHTRICLSSILFRFVFFALVHLLSLPNCLPFALLSLLFSTFMLFTFLLSLFLSSMILRFLHLAFIPTLHFYICALVPFTLYDHFHRFCVHFAFPLYTIAFLYYISAHYFYPALELA